MQAFSYYNPTKIEFGKNSIDKLQALLPSNKKIMLLYGGGSIKNNGVYDNVMKNLEPIDHVEFSGIEPNPEFDTLMQAVALAKAENVEFLLAVGGGSTIDGAKFVAAAMEFEGDPESILEGSKIKHAVPMGCILTLPATGSESNGNAVVNNREKRLKRAFGSDLVRPVFAILDPEVTYSLPPRQLSNGIVDAFVHVIEQYLTYPNHAMLQDRFAEGILQNLIELGPKVMEKDYQVRANLMWNASNALNGLIGAGAIQDWSTHMIGHQLTALYGLDHAVTLAIVLPRLLQSERDVKREKLLQYAERVWHLDTSDADHAIDSAIANTEMFFREAGIKTRLSEYQIGAEAVPAVSELMRKNKLLAIGEHRRITPEVVEEIMTASL